MSVAWHAFAEIVANHQRFILTSHIRPDCDALGSELGMAGVLEAVGKEVVIVNGQLTPPNLAFIDPTERIRAIHETIQLSDLEGYDVLIVLDTSAWAQLGPMGDVIRSTTARKLIVDHHVSEDDLGAELFKDTTAEATGRLVVEAADALGVTLTPEIANPLFAALATDTGWYRFNSATAHTYQVAARLIEAGASPHRLYQELYERDSVGRLRLKGLVLARVCVEAEGTLVHTHIRFEDFEQTGALPTDTEDLVNLTLTVDGTESAVIFIEQAEGGFKVSFRSRGAMDCSQVAGQFGGGGHKAAAGALIEGTLEEVQPRVLDAVRAAMR